MSAGVCEEIVFRGFLIRYIDSLSGYLPPSIANNGDTIAILIPAILFAVSHFYEGRTAVVKIALLAVLFGYMFACSGSLLLPVLLHFALNFVQGVIGIRWSLANTL